MRSFSLLSCFIQTFFFFFFNSGADRTHQESASAHYFFCVSVCDVYRIVFVCKCVISRICAETESSDLSALTTPCL